MMNPPPSSTLPLASKVVEGNLASIASVPKENFLINFFLGGISATIAKTTVAPTERIKLILQTQGSQQYAL